MITIFLPFLLLDILILIIYVDSPLSLQSQCRLTVRRAMGGGGLAARVDQDQKQTNWKILELGETMDTVCVCAAPWHVCHIYTIHFTLCIILRIFTSSLRTSRASYIIT